MSDTSGDVVYYRNHREYWVPIRISEELLDDMMTGWPETAEEKHRFLQSVVCHVINRLKYERPRIFVSLERPRDLERDAE